jgi:ABC-type transport system involved in multi-copper enzyme maturation permease subunit
MPIIAAYGYSYHPSHFWLLTVLTVLAGWAIYSFAFMLSCIFSERGKVYAISGGLLTLMYVINIFANVKDNLKNLQLSSFFYYYDPQAALVNGNVSTNAMIIFTAVAAVSTIVGVVWFLRRDIYL